MREIKYRGVATVNDKYNNIKVGDFVYGCFVETNVDCQILFGDGEQVSVDRETVGQYTGLKDQTGKEVYEGDIFATDEPGIFERVEWDNENSRFVLIEVFLEIKAWDLGDLHTERMEVIGNIHMNPELLESNND